jgi:hypothetical protein
VQSWESGSSGGYNGNTPVYQVKNLDSNPSMTKKKKKLYVVTCACHPKEDHGLGCSGHKSETLLEK